MYLCMHRSFSLSLFQCSKIMLAGLLSIASLQATSAAADESSPVFRLPRDDDAMIAAFRHAAAGLDEFFAKYQRPPPGAEGFSVKIGLVDTSSPPGYALIVPGSTSERRVEWFWTEGLTADKDGFSATIDSEPDLLRNVKRGQVIHFKREYIGDWMYLQNGKIVGNATICPALAYSSAEERQHTIKRFGLNCD